MTQVSILMLPGAQRPKRWECLFAAKTVTEKYTIILAESKKRQTYITTKTIEQKKDKKK